MSILTPRFFGASRVRVAAVAGLIAFMASGGLLAATPKWQRNAISMPGSVWSVETVDVNADKQLDIVAIGEAKVWALLAPTWEQRVLVDLKDGKLLYAIALDADQDGDRDIAIARYRVPWIDYREAQRGGKNGPEPQGPEFSIGWIENDGQADKPWTLHVVDKELNGTHGIVGGDVNADGRPDIIANSILGPLFPNSLVWFETPPRGSTEFKRHPITRDGADGRPHYLDFADINADGRGDVLLGDSKGGTFTWWEQPAAAQGEWRKHLIAQEHGATNIRVARVNNDATPDVIGSAGHGRGVFWFEGPDWKRHVIDAHIASPHAMDCGDFDGDGDVDVAVVSFTAFIVRWYENNGHGQFTEHDIDSARTQQAYDLKTVDLDADGRLDFVIAGRESRNVVWFRNAP